MILFGHLPDHLILFPTTAPIETHGAVRKTIPFQKGQLEVWTAQSRLAEAKGRADLFILRFYGNADRADRCHSFQSRVNQLGRRFAPAYPARSQRPYQLEAP